MFGQSLVLRAGFLWWYVLIINYLQVYSIIKRQINSAVGQIERFVSYFRCPPEYNCIFALVYTSKVVSRFVYAKNCNYNPIHFNADL